MHAAFLSSAPYCRSYGDGRFPRRNARSHIVRIGMWMTVGNHRIAQRNGFQCSVFSVQPIVTTTRVVIRKLASAAAAWTSRNGAGEAGPVPDVASVLGFYLTQ